MEKLGTIHFARYEESERLQRLLEFLLDSQQHTTLEIIQGAGICAVNSAACELRKNGFDVRCIKKTRPAIYQLADPEAAMQLAVALLDKKKAA
jgi:hypothetical protein